jgi:hypothetical protein
MRNCAIIHPLHLELETAGHKNTSSSPLGPEDVIVLTMLGKV